MPKQVCIIRCTMAGIKKWKIISSKTLFENEDILVRSDTVELPDGKISESTYLPSSLDSVIMVALNDQGDLLVQKEYSHPPRQIMWQLPGGSMNKDEAIIEAAKRELSEESGYGAKKCKKIGEFYVNNRRSNKTQYVVLCEDIFLKPGNKDKDEFIESFWLPLEEIHRMIADNEFVNINLLASLNIFFHYRQN